MQQICFFMFFTAFSMGFKIFKGLSILSNENNATIIEVNSETDFVARNDNFQSLTGQWVRRRLVESSLPTLGSFVRIQALAIFIY